jgi:dTMP kinase
MTFFSFDGVDGVGKSTQLQLFIEWLREKGLDVVSCRDPGSTQIGESLRRLLLDSHDQAISPRTEMLMYMAARAQLVDEIIRPALQSGKIVVSDRFLLANVVYQGYAGGLNVDAVWQVGSVAVDGVTPNCVFLLDMDVSQAAARRGRTPDRLEARGLAYLDRVRHAFLKEAARCPEKIVVVDAVKSVEEVQRAIRAAAEEHLRNVR